MTQPDDDRPGHPPTEPQPSQQPGQQYGQQPYREQQYGGPQYGQQPYGQQPGYGQQPYGQGQYPTQQFGQPSYSPQPYGQPEYGQYGAPQHYGPYGAAPHPSRPGTVVAAAILGFVFSAFGVLATLAALFLGAVAGDVDNDAPAGFDEFADAAVGVAVVLGLLALAWTVLLIWGSVWALSGRSRVLLLVGGSIALFFTGLGLLGSLADTTSGGDIVVNLLLFLGALAIVVLLSLRQSADFFAAHRARRGA